MSAQDRKWFLYAGVEQQGPLSLDEVRATIASGAVKGQHLAWCEGMDGWLRIADIPALQGMLLPPSAAGPPPIPGSAPFDLVREEESSPTITSPGAGPQAYAPQAPAFIPQPAYAPQAPAQRLAQGPSGPSGPGGMTAAAALTQVMRPMDDEEHPQIGTEKEDLSAFIDMKLGELDERTGSVDVPKIRQAQKEADQAARQAARSQKQFEKKHGYRRSRWVTVGGFLFFGSIVGGGVGLGYRYYQQNPRVFDLLPDTPGIRAEERQELEATASAPAAEGLRISFVLAAPALAPTFFVASNLPDGAQIDFYLHGLPGTLIGTDSAEGTGHATLEHGLGKTEALKGADGKPLPPGRYEIAAVDSVQEPADAAALLEPIRVLTPPAIPKFVPSERHLVSIKALLLSNGRSEAAYQTQLKEWTDHNKPPLDLNGAKDLAASMSGQLDALEKAAPGDLPSQTGKWHDFDGELVKQLDRAKSAAPPTLPQATLEAFEAARTGVSQAIAARTPENIAQSRAKLAQLKGILDNSVPSPTNSSPPAH